jgi:inhibitor of KinA sporulation pathway (predicted exonuclease)
VIEFTKKGPRCFVMQKIMVLDVELTQPSRRCIQIGAAVYDVRNAVCHGTFETYVNPYEPISQEITDLTGISDRDVENAPGILDAYHMLMAFHQKQKCFRNPLVWGSGVRNDSTAIYDDAQRQKRILDEKLGIDHEPLPENFMGFRVLDAKTIFQSIMLFENRGYAGGLKDCMKRLGLTFEGEDHRALVDAKNTFTIWYHLIRKMHDGFKVKK